MLFLKAFKFFRGQLLIAIKTEISDSIDTAPSEVEVEQTQTINEVRILIFCDSDQLFCAQAVYNKNEDFFLFGSIMDATMIDKKYEALNCNCHHYDLLTCSLKQDNG